MKSARIAVLLILSLCAGLRAQTDAPAGEWRNYASDKGSTKYSPLDQIDASNVTKLEIAWIWATVDAPLSIDNRRIRSTSFQGTPIMVDGVLYGSTSLSQVVAIDPASGETIWVHDPRSWESGRPPNWGFVHRGVAYWSDGPDRRIFIATGDARLIALDANTGQPIPGFGDLGQVDLKTGVRNITSSSQIGNSSPPTIVGDVVVVASAISDGPRVPNWPDGKVKGIDVRSGELLWTFNLVPQEGEFGNETWDDEAWRTVGSTNAWSVLSADEDLGYVYVPVGTPSNDWYGGHRVGQTLFAESLVCLDVETGERVWHYQFVHHGLWDYDLPAAPTLVDITVDGRPIKAVAQVSKQGFCYVLDRVTGEPVWPIEERPVPTSGVEGEASWPTQPFPTKPPAFERQGVTVDDLIDFSPELRAEAIAIWEQYDHGPLFTPPSERGSIQLPGSSGGANWQGAAFDPKTQVIYIPSITCPIFVEVNRPDPNRSTFTFVGRRGPLGGPRGLPLTKPPYGRITAIDLNKGEIVWQVANGPAVASLRDHPDLAGIDLSRVGHFGRAGPLLTKTLLFIGDGTAMTNSAGRDGGGKQFRAYDKVTGDVVWEIELPGEQTGTPMTYMHMEQQYIVIGFGGRDVTPGLVALRMPVAR